MKMRFDWASSPHAKFVVVVGDEINCAADSNRNAKRYETYRSKRERCVRNAGIGPRR